MNLFVKSRSITGQPNFLDFDMLDAMIASALKKLLKTQSNFRKRASVEEQRAQNSDRLLCAARGMGSPMYAQNRRRRTREGPEPACVQTFCLPGGTRRGGRANERPAVVPSSRRGKSLSPNSQPLSVAVRECARVTDKASENGQNSGDGAARSSWARPVPGRGDTCKASANFGLIWGGSSRLT